MDDIDTHGNIAEKELEPEEEEESAAEMSPEDYAAYKLKYKEQFGVSYVSDKDEEEAEDEEDEEEDAAEKNGQEAEGEDAPEEEEEV